MGYLTVSEIKRGLSLLGVEVATAPCSQSQGSLLACYDRRRVAFEGRDGVLISYHLADPHPGDPMEVILAFSYPQLHDEAPPEIRDLVNMLFTRRKSSAE